MSCTIKLILETVLSKNEEITIAGDVYQKNLVYANIHTAGAKKDLRNIFRYISEELLAPENAAGQTERIMTAIRKLDTMPNRNRLYEEEPWYSRGLRFFPVDNYLVFYKTDDETETVYVVRIMYGGRDVHKQLRQTEDVSED